MMYGTRLYGTVLLRRLRYRVWVHTKTVLVSKIGIIGCKSFIHCGIVYAGHIALHIDSYWQLSLYVYTVQYVQLSVQYCTVQWITVLTTYYSTVSLLASLVALTFVHPKEDVGWLRADLLPPSLHHLRFSSLSPPNFCGFPPSPPPPLSSVSGEKRDYHTTPCEPKYKFANLQWNKFMVLSKLVVFRPIKLFCNFNSYSSSCWHVCYCVCCFSPLLSYYLLLLFLLRECIAPLPFLPLSPHSSLIAKKIGPSSSPFCLIVCPTLPPPNKWRKSLFWLYLHQLYAYNYST